MSANDTGAGQDPPDPENANGTLEGAARGIGTDGKTTKVRAIVKRSRTPEPPYCWQNKEALRRIEQTFDSQSRVRLASCAYFALTRIASDKQSEIFECKVKDIANYMHYNYEQALEGIALAEAACVIHVERRKVPGTDENAPSIYTISEVIGISDKVIGKGHLGHFPETIEVTKEVTTERTENDSSNVSPKRPSRPPSAKVQLVDENYVKELKTIYRPRDVDKAIADCKAWLMTPRGKGKVCTKRRLQTFLRDAEPLSTEPKKESKTGTWADSNKAKDPQEQPCSPEQQAQYAKQLAEMKRQAFSRSQEAKAAAL